MTAGTDPLVQGDAYFAAKDFPGAVNAYRQALDQNPMLGAAWAKLTVSLTAIGDFPGAIDAGAKAVAFAPRELDAKYAYGYALAKQGHFPEAVEQLDAVISENTHRDDARNLLLWCLHQAGLKLIPDDPLAAERFLDRAHKMRPESPEPIVSLLDLYAEGGQYGKVTRLIEGLGKLSQDAVISAAIERLKAASPEVQRAIEQGSMNARSKAPSVDPVANPTRSSIQYVPCPKCKRSVADFAALCPHCGHQIKLVGTFAGRDTGPDYAWQDIALNVILGLYMLAAGGGIYAAWLASKGEATFLFQFVAVTAGSSILLSLGAFFRNDIAMNVLKYILYMRLLGQGFSLAMNMLVFRPLPFLIDVAVLGLTGFLLYLLHWASD